MAQRDPGKQVNVERTLQGLKKGSSAYSNIQQKILAGTYRTSKALKEQNIKELIKTRARLTKKIDQGKSQQEKGNLGKIEKINKLLPILEDETNVESEHEVLPVQVKPIQLPIPTPEFLNALEAEEARLGSAAVQAPVPEVQAPVPEVQAPVPEVQAPEAQAPEVPTPEAPAPAVQAPQQPPLTQPSENPCEILFDPCTREPIASLEALERRIREIKKQRDIVPIGLYGLNNDTSNYDFLTRVFVDPKISLEDMVSFKLSEKRLAGTDIYEVLSRLFVFFGGIDGVNPRDGGNYKFKDRIESGGKIYENSEQALKSMKCIASKGSGVSDITIVNVKDDKKIIKDTDPYCEIDCEANNKDNKLTKTYIMSVKWRPNKEKNAEHVDLEKLRIAEQNLLSPDQRPADSIVFIKSKRDFQISNKRMFRQYVQNLAKTFFGWDEDVKPFLEDIRRNIFEISNLTGKTPREALELQYFKPNSKPLLSLQLHQDIIVKGICDAIGKSDDNLYLIGVLPRGGKTFIAGGIIREYLRRTPTLNFNILWLTAAPNETLTQVRDELIDKFGDYNNFEFVNIREGGKITNKPHTIFFCSSQLLIASEKPNHKERIFLDNLKSGKDKLSLLFFDEAHKTATGDMTKEKLNFVIQNYIHTDLPIIFLTATYYNILYDYQIKTPNIFIWDYTDVLLSRSLATETGKEEAIQNLQKRFGKELVDYIIDKRELNGESLETMAKAYIGFPDLYFISADFQEEALQRFAEQDKYRPDAGFSLKSIFAIKPSTTIADIKTSDNKIRKDAYKIFDNLTNPKNIISLITPKEIFNDPEIINIEGGEPLRKEEGSLIEPSLLGRINKMSSEAKSRFRLDEKPTLLMFMPTGGSGTNIFYLLCGWASLLMTHKWWRDNYEIACVVSGENIDEDAIEKLIKIDLQASEGIHIINKNPKANILIRERKLHCQENSKGLLILAGEKLSMGISLPCTDVVFLFNETKTPDDIIQKMYRALTPSPGKKSAFIVDLNPVRTLAALYGYTKASIETSKDINNTQSNILDIIYDTYSWDSDIFEYSLKKGSDARPLSFQDRLRQLFEIAQKDPSNEYRINEDIGGYEKKLSDNIRRGMNSEFKSKVAGQFSSKKLESTLSRIGLKEGSKVSIENGKLVVRIPREKINNDSENEAEEDIEIIIDNFVETISDFVKYLAITSYASNFEDALREYESNITNQEGTSLRRNVLRLIRSRTEIKEGKDKELLSKLLIAAVKDYALQSSERVFRQMKGKIDEPTLRKDKILELIHKRLTPRKKQKEEKGEVFTPIEFVEEMLSHLPKSVWSNPDLKWLDPANGIGNFPVVAFYKLNEGLKGWEPNENKRKKHIIENMLYMMELQSNNTRVARNIFEKLCDNCKPNILTTDSLKITAGELSRKGWPEKYDIIMGNPPFNSGGLLKGGGTLWPKFVIKAFDLINDNGYMCFVHPPGWRKFYDAEDRDNQGKLWYTIREKGWNLEYINVSDQPLKHFPIVDYYVIHAKNTNKLTKYDSKFMGITDSGETILDYPFIPNMLNDETMGILKKLFDAKGEPIHIIRNQSFQATVKDEGKPGIPHYHFTYRTGEKQIYKREYSSVPEYITKEKVIMTFKAGYEKGRLFAFYTDENIGTTANSMYMLTKSKAQGDKLVRFFNSDIITFFMKITQYSAPPNHINEFKILNKLQVPDSLESYNLTQKESDLIKKIVGIKGEEPAKGGERLYRYTRKVKRV